MRLGFLVVLVGCWHNDGRPAPGDEFIDNACRDLEPGQCGEVDGCVPIFAVPLTLHDDEWCRDSQQEAETVGCMHPGQVCDDVAVAAENFASTEAWEFPSTCRPGGLRFVEVNPPSCP